MDHLEEHIAQIIRNAGRPLAISEIERHLTDGLFNTFVVRAAVYRLIQARRVEFTPGREVRITDSSSLT